MLKTRKEGGVILQTFCISMVAAVLFATDLLMGKEVQPNLPHSGKNILSGISPWLCG